MVAVTEPIDPRVRLAISQWPDDAPRSMAPLSVGPFRLYSTVSREAEMSLADRGKHRYL